MLMLTYKNVVNMLYLGSMSPPPEHLVILNSQSPVDDFEFRSDQFLPVSTQRLVLPFTPADSALIVYYNSISRNGLVLFSACLKRGLFFQYLESIFGLLFKLLQEVTECDTKMHVLHVISCVIERVNTQVRR